MKRKKLEINEKNLIQNESQIRGGKKRHRSRIRLDNGSKIKIKTIQQ